MKIDNNWFLAVVVLSTFPALNTFAQDTKESNAEFNASRIASEFRRDRIEVELKPFPAFAPIGGKHPIAFGAVGFGIEYQAFDRVALNLDAYAIDSKFAVTSLEGKNDDLRANKLTGYNTELGARYYGQPKFSTWFTGALLGYMRTKVECTYKDQSRVDAKSSAMTPGLQAGYRWLTGYQDDFVIRAGAIVAANVVQTRDRYLRDLSAAQDADDVRAQLDDRLETAALARFDLGLGYTF